MAVVVADADGITLQEFKDNIGVTNTQHDTELPRFLNAAARKVVELCGPIAPKAISQDIRDAHDHVLLREWPVLSVTSVTLYPSGRVITADDITVAGPRGYVLDPDGPMISYPFGGQHVRVAYTAGRLELTDDLKTAILDLAAHLWRASQNRTGLGQRAVFGGANPDTSVPFPAGFAMPRRVTELLDGELRPPVIG